jgi:hypothetical protein
LSRARQRADFAASGHAPSKNVVIELNTNSGASIHGA